MPRGPLWLARPSRYAGMPPARARLALALLALLMAMLALVPPPVPDARAPDTPSHPAIVEAMRHGGDYYAVAAREMRVRPDAADGDPLPPLATIRLPALATIEARLPPVWVIALLFSLVAATALAWAGRIAAATPAWPPRLVAALLLAGGLIVPVRSAPGTGHEVWAGLLVAWSIAVWRPGRWIEAAALGTAAMLIRETAAGYVIVMAALAWAQGSRREALGWAAGLVALAATLAAHGWAVAQVTGPLDSAAGGWTGPNDAWFVVTAIRDATALTMAPPWASAPLIVLALFGWSAWRDPAGSRMTATLIAYAVLVCAAGRFADAAWGMLVAPAWLVGLVFVPDALRDLARAALDRRAAVVTEVAPGVMR